jgi:hypothetical protein
LSPTSLPAHRRGAGPAPSRKASRSIHRFRRAARRWSRTARPRRRAAGPGRMADAIGLCGSSAASIASGTARSWAGIGRPCRGPLAWGAFGQPRARAGPDGRPIFRATTPDVPRVCAVVAGLASASAKSLIVPTVSPPPVQSAAPGEHCLGGIVQHFGPPGRTLAEAQGRHLILLSLPHADQATINPRAFLASCEPTVCLLLIVGSRLKQSSRDHRKVERDQPAMA